MAKSLSPKKKMLLQHKKTNAVVIVFRGSDPKDEIASYSESFLIDDYERTENIQVLIQLIRTETLSYCK